MGTHSTRGSILFGAQKQASFLFFLVRHFLASKIVQNFCVAHNIEEIVQSWSLLMKTRTSLKHYFWPFWTVSHFSFVIQDILVFVLLAKSILNFMCLTCLCCIGDKPFLAQSFFYFLVGGGVENEKNGIGRTDK